MKKARADDHWRRLQAKGQPNHAQKIEAKAISNFPSDPIEFTGPITVITGLNGAGKSTIINSIRLLVTREAEPRVELTLLKSCTGSLNGNVISSGNAVSAEAILDNGKISVSPEILGLEVTWIDTAFEIPELIKALRIEQNLDEALAQVSPIVYADSDLADISWLVGKTYSSCKVFELDGFYGRTVIPYFSVESQGVRYGTEGMGLGEASLHYLYWNLKRVENHSLILIEEPETFISSRSQSALMDCLAHTCLTKNCTAIVTTHSPQIFARVPPEHTMILSQIGGTTKIIKKETAAARLAALSVPLVNEKAGFFLVEDRMAREFTKIWLQSTCPDLVGHWRIVDMNSSSHIIKSLDCFPFEKGAWFRAIGLLDGDERGKGHQSKGTFCFLPTSEPAEVFLRRVILANPDKIAQDLSLDPDEFQVCLTVLEGQDHHDWFIDLVKSFKNQGVTLEKLIEVSTARWLEANEGHSSLAVLELRKAISPPSESSREEPINLSPPKFTPSKVAAIGTKSDRSNPLLTVKNATAKAGRSKCAEIRKLTASFAADVWQCLFPKKK